MNKEHEIELKNEIAHIFDSGANKIRIFEMVKNFIDKRKEAINYTRCCTELCDCEEPFIEVTAEECGGCGMLIKGE
jgi:hypothetical protein